ncbi:MAG: porphobilinogen synthase [Candidatus Omnitrophota bacterium]
MARKFMGINIKLDNLIYPYFVISGINKKEKIKSFPGIFRYSIDCLMKDVVDLRKMGISKILLFGIPDIKDIKGSGAYDKDNIISLAVKKIKDKLPDLIIITDVCMCVYTTHGHCGILKNRGIIDNARTLEILSKIAVLHAQAGVDFVAPSAMAKCQVATIRKALDEHGHKKTKILGYSAKFASNFYGPFRNACGSTPKFGDRTSYQLGYLDSKTALDEIQQDIKEGADIVMVKPAFSYLDIIREAKSKFNYPMAVYNVSGEYSLIKNGVKLGLFREEKAVFEILSSIKRAGADFIITYHAKDVARWLA